MFKIISNKKWKEVQSTLAAQESLIERLNNNVRDLCEQNEKLARKEKELYDENLKKDSQIDIFKTDVAFFKAKVAELEKKLQPQPRVKGRFVKRNKEE